MVEFASKPESVHDLIRVEDQERIDDDAVTVKLPARKSSRNRAIYDASTKESSRNRMFKKAESYHNFPTRANSTLSNQPMDKIREQPTESIRRTKTVK